MVRRGAWALDTDALRAASWEGIISAHDLVQLGIPERTVYRRTAQDGPWTLLLPATVMLSKGTPTARQYEIAALVRAGESAMLTGLNGIRHHGLRRGGGPAVDHVLIPLAHRVLSTGRARFERTIRLPRPLLRDGLPVAPLARCIVDHTRRLKDEKEISSIVTEAVQRGMVLLDELWLELEMGSRKGTAAPRRVLEAAGAGVRSPVEFTARDFWESFDDFPRMEWNVSVYDQAGRFVAIVDGLVRELGFAWEIDSVDHHFATPDQVRETLGRQRRLRAVGLHVFGSRPRQQDDDPRGLREDLLAHLAIAAALPPPRAVYGPSPAPAR